MSLTRTTVLVIGLVLLASPSRADSQHTRRQTDLAFLADALTRYHANAFHSISQGDFEKLVRAASIRIRTTDDAGTIVAFKQLVASIGDAHTGFGFSSAPPMDFYIFPIKAYRYPDGIYIQAATPGFRDFVGARITSIGGVGIGEAERRLNTVADASNEWTKRWWLPFTFRGEVFKALGLSKTADSALFGFEMTGRTQFVEIPVLRKPFGVGFNLGAPPNSDWVDGRTGPTPLYLQHLEHRLWFAFAGNATLYIRCSIVGDSDAETFDGFFARAFAYADQHQIDKIVLDLRMNGGGDNTLTPAIVARIIQRPLLNRRGHLFAIIGRSTQSAAENLVDRLQRDTAAVFVGEPTGERPNMFGDPQPFVLPQSKITINISSLYWQDMGPRDHRDTTGPEIAAELSETDFENGIDPAMEAIVGTLPPSFEDVVKASVSAGDGAVRDAYSKYVSDSVHRFTQIQAATEDVMGDLVDQQRYSAARVLCDLNLLRYQSAEAYDALGALEEAMKRNDAAKRAYHEALRVDPRDAVAGSRLSALQ